jgi:hypothetical protein
MMTLARMTTVVLLNCRTGKAPIRRMLEALGDPGADFLILRPSTDVGVHLKKRLLSHYVSAKFARKPVDIRANV